MNYVNPIIYDDIEEKIRLEKNIQADIQAKISKLEQQLTASRVKEHLLNLKSMGPVIVPSDDQIGKYKFLSQPLFLPSLGIKLYPLWISNECTYPKWSKDFTCLNIVDYEVFNHGKGYEVLIDGIQNSLYCTYSESQKFIKEHNLTIPRTYHFNYTLYSNIKIYYSKGVPIEYHQHKNKNYHICCSDDENMVLNTSQIKYILVLPSNYSHVFDYFDRDYLE